MEKHNTQIIETLLERIQSTDDPIDSIINYCYENNIDLNSIAYIIRNNRTLKTLVENQASELMMLKLL